MTKTTSMDIYIVDADRASGQWLSEPEALGQSVSVDYWAKIDGNHGFHYDTYEVELIDETGEVVGEETRAIVVRWTD